MLCIGALETQSSASRNVAACTFGQFTVCMPFEPHPLFRQRWIGPQVRTFTDFVYILSCWGVLGRRCCELCHESSFVCVTVGPTCVYIRPLKQYLEQIGLSRRL